MCISEFIMMSLISAKGSEVLKQKKNAKTERTGMFNAAKVVKKSSRRQHMRFKVSHSLGPELMVKSRQFPIRVSGSGRQ